MIEGGTRLYRQLSGTGAAGYNPIKEGITDLAPQYGNGIYNASYLTLSLLSLAAPVKLVVGFADSSVSALGPIERTKSMFKVEVPKFDNPILNPLTGTVLIPQIGAQAITVFNTSKSAKNVADEVVNPKDGNRC
jgi:filamentous hemagglutinin